MKSNIVKLIKRLNDGRYIFTKEGMYFTLTDEQVEQVNELIETFKHEEGKDCG